MSPLRASGWTSTFLQEPERCNRGIDSWAIQNSWCVFWLTEWRRITWRWVQKCVGLGARTLNLGSEKCIKLLYYIYCIPLIFYFQGVGPIHFPCQQSSVGPGLPGKSPANRGSIPGSSWEVQWDCSKSLPREDPSGDWEIVASLGSHQLINLRNVRLSSKKSGRFKFGDLLHSM